jgi:hypothetical protein
MATCNRISRYEGIIEKRITTKKGHTLHFFFNEETNLVVVDYSHANDRGGTELLRVTLNDSMLSHVHGLPDLEEEEA